jgi:hypothetical protein
MAKKKPDNTLIPGICRVLRQGFMPAHQGGIRCLCHICKEEIAKGDLAIKGLHWVHITCFGAKLKDLAENFDEVIKYRSAEEI